jgi:hypothetical protein
VNKASFILTFDERDDGVKTWSACCSRCAAQLVGDNARKTGHPVVIGDHRIVVDKIVDHGDLQRSLEVHAESCPRKSDLARPEPTSMPGPGEPRG